MGLKAADPAEENGGGGGGGDGGAQSSVSCSICLEVVADGGDRSTARLQCGHQFHLDCIGSAFNAKGLMQCPNCRKIEKGTWLYSNSYRYSEFSVDDWPHDEDLYDLNYTEMPYGIHWCPFSRLARVPSSFEEGDSSPSIAYHDLLGHPAVFAEHPANSSSTHSCPYLAYFHPLQASSSSGSQVPIENAIDGATFHHPWNNLSGPMDIPTSPAFPASDLYYHRWDSHSPPFSHHSNLGSSIEQESVSSGTTRSSRLESDTHPRTGSFLHPFIVGHGSTSRASSSAASSSLPPYINSRGHVRVHELHASYQHHNTPGLHSGSRRSGGMRGMAPIGPTSSPPESAGFFLLAPPAATSRSPQDVDAGGGSHFYAWERDRFAPFPLLPVDRDLPWWGPPPQASGSSDSSNRTGFWPRHSSERSSSQSRPPHIPRMHPFI